MRKLLLAWMLCSMGAWAQADDGVQHKPGQVGGVHSLDRNRIDAQRSYCNNNICTYDLAWSVRGTSSVVVLEVRGGPEHGTVKLYACEGANGRGRADWIRRDGAQYIFHLYSSSRCTKDIYRMERPVDSVVVQERESSSGQYSSGRIDAQRRVCQSDMCEYELSWRVRGSSSVVTLVDTETGREKLFACSGQTGRQNANWIRRNGTRYQFKLYDSNNCTANVGQYVRPVGDVIVRER